MLFRSGGDGNLYGNAAFEGSSGNGNVFRIVEAGPRLNSFRTNGQFVVSWRTNYTGFSLRTTASLNDANWIHCTNVIGIVGQEFFVTNSMSVELQFFRLMKDTP